jgi:hypothetical protein
MAFAKVSRTGARRITAVLRRIEGSSEGKQGAQLSPLYTPEPDQEVAFELTAEIPEEHDPQDEYAAHIRAWDPSQHAGKGAYVTGTDDIVVRDTREVGYYGAVGAKGACKMRFTSTGTTFGEIIDLECP